MSKVLKVQTVPKRRIERIISQMGNLISNSVQNKIIHTVEDRKTLVRSIINLRIRNTDGVADALISYCLVLHVRPAATSVVSVTTSELLDQDFPMQELWRWRGTLEQLTRVGNPDLDIISVDIKSMRKLAVGDEVCFSQIASTASNLNISGVIVQFFKE